MKKTTAIFFFIAFIGTACHTDSPTPKPVGYNRVDLKEPSYREYENPLFSFQYSEYARIDTVKTQDKTSFWFNIAYPALNAQIHFSYFPIDKAGFRTAVEESHQLAYGHVLKANGIEQTLFENPEQRTSGIIYMIEGNVATPVQFFITDSISNFIRASFYYNAQVKQDSVAPVTDYICHDITKLIETFKWKRH